MRGDTSEKHKIIDASGFGRCFVLMRIREKRPVRLTRKGHLRLSHKNKTRNGVEYGVDQERETMKMKQNMHEFKEVETMVGSKGGRSQC